MRKLTEKNVFLDKIKSFINPTEDMSQRELSMALNKIIQKLNIEHSFDVPYLAGYSKDAKTIYIDRLVPKFLIYKKQRYNIHRFLVLHEIIEKALIDHLGHLHYQLAHEVASRAEYAAITGEKLPYHFYNRIIQEKLAKIREKEYYHLPSDLDLKPYFDSKDKTLISRIKRSAKIKWQRHKNTKLERNAEPKILHTIIKTNGNFPNNSYLPLLIYRQALMFNDASLQAVKQILRDNGWKNIWVDGVYNYDHYHSNNHEALIIFSGRCLLQIGGPKGKKISLSCGDVIIFPAGVAHKKINASTDFKCIGSYPFAIDYDMNVGKANEHPEVDKNIKKLKLPKTDPIFGKKGPLLHFWRNQR